MSDSGGLGERQSPLPRHQKLLLLSNELQLLGLDSNDIDIALTDMMGVAFAEILVEYASSVKQLDVKGVAKVESNPEQSKHLETAKTTILGLDLDIVNLRSEEYAENSRIPTQVVCESTAHVFACVVSLTVSTRHLVHHCRMLYGEILPSMLFSTMCIPDLLKTTLARYLLLFSVFLVYVHAIEVGFE